MTSIQHRFFVDECLPPELIETYLRPHIGLAEISAEVVHYVDKFGPNGKWKDRDFIPELARDRRWVVVTADRGRQSAEFESMVYLCHHHGVTLVALSTNVVKRTLSFYGPQLLAHWDAVVGLNSGPRGQQYALRLHDKLHSRTLFVATKCPGGYRVEKGCCVQK